MNQKEYNSIQCKKYYQTHKQQKKEYEVRNRERITSYYRERQAKNRLKVIERLGKNCINPYNLNHGDFTLCDQRTLQIDHINGKGDKERKILRNGYYFRLLQLPEDELKNNYQLLCANCNWIKRFEKRENRPKRVF